MRLIKFDKENFLTALYIALIAVIIHSLLLFFYVNSFSKSVFSVTIVFFVLIFAVTYLVLIFRFDYFVVKRVKALYKNMFPTIQTSGLFQKSSDIDVLTRNLKKLNADKNSEIELLKNQESFRREFIGNLAHELKTPLFTIQGYVLTLLEGKVKDKETVKKYLNQAAKGVDRLTYIIKDLDVITKFESGTSTLKCTVFDIRKTVENVFELFEIQAQKTKTTLRFDREYPKPILLYADEERIQQVLTNLIVNSLKYGIEQGVTEVSFVAIEKNKILIKISDNGEGIDKAHLPRLFERFYRVDKTRNRNQGGSGLGLAIVKHIIEAHDEKIFVESEPKVGSEFSFSLPLANIKEL